MTSGWAPRAHSRNGTTRRISSSASTTSPSWPARTPPTSTMSAPSSTASSRAALGRLEVGVPVAGEEGVAGPVDDRHDRRARRRRSAGRAARAAPGSAASADPRRRAVDGSHGHSSRWLLTAGLRPDLRAARSTRARLRVSTRRSMPRTATMARTQASRSSSPSSTTVTEWWLRRMPRGVHPARGRLDPDRAGEVGDHGQPEPTPDVDGRGAASTGRRPWAAASAINTP